MTSNKPFECFVYITLPGKTEAITAGKYRLTMDHHGAPVGQFIYGKSYLDRHGECVEFDPVELKLRDRVYTTIRMNGTFGALRDATPDAWGRRLIEKRLGAASELSELQYMLNSPDDRAGALGFGFGVTPPAPIRAFNRTMDLNKLMEVPSRS